MDDHDNSQQELSKEEVELVTELGEKGPATPIQLALRLQALPDQLRPKLRKLKDDGWLEVQPRKGYETEIYFVSKKARAALTQR